MTLTGVDPNSTIKDVKKKISLQSMCSFKIEFLKCSLSITTLDTFDYRTRHLPRATITSFGAQYVLFRGNNVSIMTQCNLQEESLLMTRKRLAASI